MSIGLTERKVLMLTGSLSGGGAETQLLIIARQLALAGIACEVVAPLGVKHGGRSACLLEEAVSAGVEFRLAKGIRGWAHVFLGIWRELIRGTCLLWTWGYRMELFRLVCFPLTSAVFSIRSASESQAWRWRWLFRYGFGFTWRYLSNSQLGIQIADRVASGIAAKAWVVPNAMSPTFLKAEVILGERPKKLELLMLGNVRYKVKGYDLALIVGRKIRDERLPIRIRIGGSQYANEIDLQAEIRQADLVDIISWVGPIKDSLSFLQSGHAFMLLSRYEGMPNALFEAMALGLPCVATAVGDLPLYAKKSNGIRVIAVEDVNAAYRELCWIWNNWEEAVAMGLRAKKYCQDNLSEEHMIDNVIRALELDRPPEPTI